MRKAQLQTLFLGLAFEKRTKGNHFVQWHLFFFSFGGCPTKKLSFPKRVPFSRVTEELRQGVASSWVPAVSSAWLPEVRDLCSAGCSGAGHGALAT